MSCNFCGKKISGKNALWTHVVFKHPEKADTSFELNDEMHDDQENRHPNIDSANLKQKTQEQNPNRSQHTYKKTKHKQIKASYPDCQTNMIHKRELNLSESKKDNMNENIYELVIEKETNEMLEEHIKSLEDNLEKTRATFENIKQSSLSHKIGPRLRSANKKDCEQK